MMETEILKPSWQRDADVMLKTFRKYKTSIKEAIDTGEYPQGFDPGKKDHIEGGQDIERIMPDLGPNAQSYIEHITSQSYKQAVERLGRYTNTPTNELSAKYPNINSLMVAIMAVLQDVTVIEQQNKEYFEGLALETVLSLPEFEIVKKMHEDNEIEFKIELVAQGGVDSLANAIGELDEETPLEGEDDLAPSEEAVIELTEQEISDESLKRELANFMMQGNAVSKLFLYNMVVEKLEEIDETLPQKYGVLSSIIQISYYATPLMALSQGMAQPGAQGGEEIDVNEGTIHAQGTTFPFLIHEIVKGIWEYMSADTGSIDDKRGETLDDETWQIMSGPELYRQFSSNFPNEDLKYLPLTYKLLLQQDVATIKEILTGGGRGQRLITNLINQAKQQMSEYENWDEDPEEDNPWEDGGGDGDEEGDDDGDEWKNG